MRGSRGPGLRNGAEDRATVPVRCRLERPPNPGPRPSPGKRFGRAMHGRSGTGVVLRGWWRRFAAPRLPAGAGGSSRRGVPAGEGGLFDGQSGCSPPPSRRKPGSRGVQDIRRDQGMPRLWSLDRLRCRMRLRGPVSRSRQTQPPRQERAEPPHSFARECEGPGGPAAKQAGRPGDGDCPCSARTTSEPWAPAFAGEAVGRDRVCALGQKTGRRCMVGSDDLRQRATVEIRRPASGRSGPSPCRGTRRRIARCRPPPLESRRVRRPARSSGSPARWRPGRS